MSMSKDIIEEFIRQSELVNNDIDMLVDEKFFKKYINISICVSGLCSINLMEDEEMKELMIRACEIRDVISNKLISIDPGIKKETNIMKDYFLGKSVWTKLATD